MPEDHPAPDDAPPTPGSGRTLVAPEARPPGDTPQMDAPDPSQAPSARASGATIVAPDIAELPSRPRRAAGTTLVAPDGPELDDDETDEAEAEAAPTTWSDEGHGSGPAPLEPGGRLGRWVLDRRLGEGATAEVWSAHHQQLGAPVAIKVFHRKNLAFHNVLGEARAAAGIPSPHVVWVYDVDTLDGHHCIVMELCAEGDTVARSLRDDQPHDPDDAARILSQAARGVQAAHEVDVFHKDIKPANILINPGDGRAQITDFGLANPALWTRRTPSGEHAHQETVCVDVELEAPAAAADTLAPIRGSLRIGTPEFMAPEQAAGLRRDLDPEDDLHRRHLTAIDVYGLGATLYHLLAGRPPHPVDPDDDLDVRALMAEVTSTPAPSLRRVAPGVPRRLARIVEKAMDADPSRRHRSAAALADDLDAWRSTRPTSVDHAPLTRLGVHLWRERARVAVLGALAAITLASSLVVWRNNERIADQQAELSEQQTELSEQRDALDALASERDRVTADLSTTRQTLATTRTALDEKSGQLDARQRQLTSTTRELSQTEEVLATTTGELDVTRSTLASVTAERDALVTERDHLRDERDALTSSVEMARAARDAAQQDLDAARTRVEELSRALAEARTARDAAQARLADLTADLGTREARVATLEDQVRSLGAEVDRLQAQMNQGRARFEQLRAENQQLRVLLQQGGDAP